MASTTFVDGVTLTDDEWFNHVNDATYEVLGDGTTPPTTAIAAMKNLFKKGADIASASTTNLANATGNYLNITGNTTINSFGTVNAGVPFWLVFDSTPTITYNASSMILPTGASITAAAGDTGLFMSLGSGNWRCFEYIRAAGNALANNITITSSVATTSGVSQSISSSIPAGVKRISIMLNEVSCGADNYLIQIGDSGGLETTGYTSSSVSLTNAGAIASINATNGFVIHGGAAGANVTTGIMTLLLSGTATTWVESHSMKCATTVCSVGGGQKQLSGVLDRVSIFTIGATAFDNGSVSLQYD